MKTATFPSLRVTAELRAAAEQCLQDGETISAFVEQAIRESIERRRHQSVLIARGLASRDEAQRTGCFRCGNGPTGGHARQGPQVMLPVCRNVDCYLEV